MVLDHDAEAIYCLTNIVEENRIKCHQYWPEAGKLSHLDDICLENLGESVMSDGACVVRNIQVTKVSMY